MPHASFRLAWVSERHLRIQAEGASVRALLAGLDAAAIPSLIDAVPAFSTLLLHFDGAALDPDLAEAAVRGALARAGESAAPAGRLVRVPACFEGDCAPDLDSVAAMNGLARDEAVGLFLAAEFEVAFIGFSPGFPYLTGLPARLATPRLDTPRPRVPPGSIAIAGDQAGIYPHPTPGGWRLIARTPLRLFDAAREHAALLRIGDRVRFEPISLGTFLGSDGAR